jgi:hypothetical protein
LPALRVSISKSGNKEAAISLHDAQGRMRLRLMVDAAGTPKLEFLDEQGGVVASLPSQ